MTPSFEARIAAARNALPDAEIAPDGRVDGPPAPRGLRFTPMLDREWVEVSGRDRVKFLQGLVTNDMAALDTGSGCAAALLTVKGKLQALFGVSALDGSLAFDVAQTQGAFVVETLDRYLFRDKVTLGDLSADRIAAVLWGEGEVAGLPVPGAAAWSIATGEFAGAAVAVVRDPWTGGRRVWTTLDAASTVWGALSAAATLTGRDSLEAARVRAGQPRFGVDVDENTIPLEASSLDVVSFSKGCYLGQEVIARVDSRGAVNKHLVGLELDDLSGRGLGCSLVAGPGAEKPGRVLGSITSEVALDDGRRIGLGTVRRGAEHPGTEVEVRDGESLLGLARVAALPFP